jgi:hypothetical protein
MGGQELVVPGIALAEGPGVPAVRLGMDAARGGDE